MAVENQNAVFRLQQRLRREELKLARLKTKDDKARRADARLKRRLGRLLFLIGWQNHSLDDIDSRLRDIPALLAREEQFTNYRVDGETFLRQSARELDNGRISSDSESWAERNHRMITVGGLMKKNRLHEIDQSTLMGVLLEQVDVLQGTR